MINDIGIIFMTMPKKIFPKGKGSLRVNNWLTVLGLLLHTTIHLIYY